MIAYVLLWIVPVVFTLIHRNRHTLRIVAIAAWPPNVMERHRARIESEMAELDAYWKRIRTPYVERPLQMRFGNGRRVPLC